MKNHALRSARFAALVVLLNLIHLVSSAQVQTARYISMASGTNAFYEYLPQGYNPGGSETYPVILFIHGMGELGSGTSATMPKMMNGSLPQYIRDGKFPTSFTVNGRTSKFIVISPQFTKWPTSVTLNTVIDYILSKYKADRTRIYLTGLSMGGGVTWDFAANRSNISRLAAIVPVCGAAAATVTKGRIFAENNLPIWALHNLYDPTVVSSGTVNFINYINAAPAPNPKARKTIFNASGHNAWTQAYNPTYREEGKNIYEWMLQYTTTRGAAPAAATPPSVNAGADQTINLPLNKFLLTASASTPGTTVRSYAWTKTSGPANFAFLAATASSNQVYNLVAGTYVFRCTITTATGATAYDEVKIIVNPAAVTTFSVTAGADQTTDKTYTNFDGSASGSTVKSYTWTKISGPETYNFADRTEPKSLLNNLGAGNYVFRLTAVNTAGATAYDDVSIVVKTTTTLPQTSTKKYVKVKVFGGSGAYSSNEWNNWSIGTALRTNVTSGALKFSDGTSSNVKATLSHSSGISDNGSAYAGGMAPKEVLRHASWSTIERTITFTGLTPSKRYDFEFYDSRATNPNNSTNLKNGSLQKAVSTNNNFTNKIQFLGLTPNSSGTIVITISKKNQYTYLNGFMITEGSSASSSSVARSATQLQSEGSVNDEPQVSAFPASTSDRAAIRLNNDLTGKFDVTITDTEGNLVKELEISKSQAGQTQTYVSLADLAAGEYVIIVKQADYQEATLVTKLK